MCGFCLGSAWSLAVILLDCCLVLKRPTLLVVCKFKTVQGCIASFFNWANWAFWVWLKVFVWFVSDVDGRKPSVTVCRNKTQKAVYVKFCELLPSAVCLLFFVVCGFLFAICNFCLHLSSRRPRSCLVVAVGLWIVCNTQVHLFALPSLPAVARYVSQFFWYRSLYLIFMSCWQNVLCPLIPLNVQKNCGISDWDVLVYRKAGDASLLLNFIPLSME